MTWNTHGLGGSKLLAVDAKIRDLDVDAAVIAEAELTAGEVPTLTGYDTFLPKVSKSKKARVVIFVRKELHVEQMPTPADVPIVAVQASTSTLVGIYRQFALPSTSEKVDTVRGLAFEIEQLGIIIQCLGDLSDKCKAMYICGDLNLDLARKEDKSYYRGALLERWLGEVCFLGLEWARTDSTFLSDGVYNGSRRKATIDQVYSRSHADVHAKTLDDSLSDHLPVLAITGGNQPRLARRQKFRERNWKALDPEVLCLALLGNDWTEFLSIPKVSEAVAFLKDAIIYALDVVAPVHEYETPNNMVRLRQDTRATIQARNQARRRGAPHFRQLRNKALSLVRRDYITKNISMIKKEGQAAAWRIVADACGKGKGSELPLPNVCKNDVEAANHCNKFFIEKVRKLRENLGGDVCSGMDVDSDINLGDTGTNKFRFKSIGTSDIKKAVSQLRAGNTVGVDGIPITVFKAAISVLALPLTHVVNLILKECVWPDDWKEAIIVPVLKAGKPRLDVSSYRPVSLLCAISKVVERVLHNQITEFVETKFLLPEEQHGFRSGRGVDTALATMLTKAAKALDAGRKVALAAFDYSAAFDTVEPDILLSKTKWLEDGAKSLLRSYLLGRRQRVRWNKELSNLIEVEYGVPQGSVLGPLLFIILTSDLPATVKAATTSALDKISTVDTMASIGDVVASPSGAEVNFNLYADDTSGLISSESWEITDQVRNLAASSIAKYSCLNGLHLNSAKTQILKLAPETPASFTLNLLGVSMNKALSFSSHHKKMLLDLKRRIGIIRRLQTTLSRGPLLNEIARSLVVGKVQSCAWITRKIRIEGGQGSARGSTEDTATQVALNDLSRVLLGIKREDRVRVEDLSNKTGIPTLNEISTRQAAVAAWKAVNAKTKALEGILIPYDYRTRGAAEGLRRPASISCLAATNLATAWNNSEDLRSASTLSRARVAAKKLASEARWA